MLGWKKIYRMIDNSANHIKLDNRLVIKINVPCFCLYFVIMQIYNRHEGTRGRAVKKYWSYNKFYVECKSRFARRSTINGWNSDRKKIADVMQIASNEWFFNYFSLVIYYRLGDLFLHLRQFSCFRWKPAKLMAKLKIIEIEFHSHAHPRMTSKIFIRSATLVPIPSSSYAPTVFENMWNTTINYRSQWSNRAQSNINSKPTFHDTRGWWERCETETGSGSAGSTFHWANDSEDINLTGRVG